MADNYMGPGLTLDDVYPLGSIYMSANATDPANLFGRVHVAAHSISAAQRKGVA